MNRIHVSGISIRQVIERHSVFQNLSWNGREKFPDMSNIFVVEKKDGTGGIIGDNDSFGGGIKWAYFTGKNPMKGKQLGGLEKDEVEFLKRDYPKLYDALINLDA